MSGEAKKMTPPADKDSFLDAAIAMVPQGQWEEIAALADAAQEALGDDPEIRFVKAMASYVMDDFVGALSTGEAAFNDGAQSRESAEFLAVLNTQLGDLTGSLYYAKLTTALPESEHLAKLLPQDMPQLGSEFTGIQEKPLQQRAIVAMAQHDWDAAEHWFRQHLAVDPEGRDAYLGLCQCLFLFDRFEEAVEVLRAARHMLPWDAGIASMLGTALTSVGSLGEGQACHRWAMDADADSALVHAAAAQDLLFDPNIGLNQAAAAFRNWGERFGAAQNIGMPAPKAAPKDRLTVGYLVSNVGRRPVSSALAGILAKHNAEKYRVVGFGFGALTDPSNIAFQKAFETWHDVRHIDPITVGAMVSAEGIDILVDVGGFGTPEMLTVLGGRLAPVQMAWLNTPCGTGIANVDYLLVDSFLDSNEGLGDLVAETPLNIDTGAVIVSLPESTESIEPAITGENPTFAADVSLAELNPRLVETFARILHAVPESQLILRDRGFQTDGCINYLLGQFGNFGLAHRVDLVSNVDPLPFFAGADVALMPFPVARPETATEALWSGTPVVCLAGEGPHERLAASMLHHAGLADDSVVDTVEEYIAKAVDWSGDGARRKAFADGIQERLRGAVVADAAAQAAALEQALDEAWKRACDATG